MRLRRFQKRNQALLKSFPFLLETIREKSMRIKKRKMNIETKEEMTTEREKENRKVIKTKQIRRPFKRKERQEIITGNIEVPRNRRNND